jgi:2-keto-4-pentenoate hydratase/2-oxohepta-3-ene-1,7-dioic acid hydratase in catechol pathway
VSGRRARHGHLPDSRRESPMLRLNPAIATVRPKRNVGDLLGSGTLSGPEKDQRGSLLEISWNGTEPVELPDGGKRTFLEDGDSLVMRAWCQGYGYRVGFGEVEGTIIPAL